MSEPTTPQPTLEPEPSPEVTPAMAAEVEQVRNGLANFEKFQGDAEFAEQFSKMTFETIEDVYKAYGQRSVQPQEPTGQPQEKLLAGKYKTQEELEQGYLNLAKKLGSKEPLEEPKASPEDAPKPEDGANQIPAPTLEAMNSYFKEHGQLAENHYATLAKAGLTKADVDTILSLAQAGASVAEQSAAQVEATIRQEAGGSEAYDAMINWAASNLSPSEVRAYNDAVSSNPEVAKLAVAGLKAKFESKMGRGSTDGFASGAKAGTAGGVRGFESQQEIIDAFSDPRFSRSPSYRREVEARMAKTQL